MPPLSLHKIIMLFLDKWFHFVDQTALEFTVWPGLASNLGSSLFSFLNAGITGADYLRKPLFYLCLLVLMSAQKNNNIHFQVKVCWDV